MRACSRVIRKLSTTRFRVVPRTPTGTSKFILCQTEEKVKINKTEETEERRSSAWIFRARFLPSYSEALASTAQFRVSQTADFSHESLVNSRNVIGPLPREDFTLYAAESAEDRWRRRVRNAWYHRARHGGTPEYARGIIKNSTPPRQLEASAAATLCPTAAY